MIAQNEIDSRMIYCYLTEISIINIIEAAKTLGLNLKIIVLTRFRIQSNVSCNNLCILNDQFFEHLSSNTAN